MFKEKIIGYFKETIPKIHKKFDSNHPSELNNLAEYVSKIYVILAKIINNPDQNSISDVEFNTALLLWRGTNTIIASFELIRSGYGIEPLVVPRNALETCTTAIDLYKNADKLKDFKENKYKSSKSISVAKEVIPVIGKLHGVLTNFYTHIGFMSSYPLYYRDETGTIALITGGMYGKENQYHLNMDLSLLEWLLSIYLASTEYIFFRFCEMPEFWQRIDNDKLKFVFSKGEWEKHKKREIRVIQALKSLNNM